MNTTKVQIVGYLPFSRNNRTSYRLSLVATDSVLKNVGAMCYEAFVTDAYLKKVGVSPDDLIGLFIYVYRRDNHTFTTFKNYEKAL